MALKLGKIKGKDVLKGALPVGELSWTVIRGEGKDNYNKDGKVYASAITWPTEVAQPIVDQIAEFYNDAKNSKPQQGGMGHSIGVLVSSGEGDEKEEKFIAHYDVPEKAELSGRIQMQFQTNVSFEGKKTVVPVYNSKATKVTVPEDFSIGNGSIGSLQVTIKHGSNERKQFISKYLNGVQLIKYVEYTGEADFEEEESEAGAEGWEGFEDADTGFTSAGEEASPDLNLD